MFCAKGCQTVYEITKRNDYATLKLEQMQNLPSQKHNSLLRNEIRNF